MVKLKNARLSLDSISMVADGVRIDDFRRRRGL